MILEDYTEESNRRQRKVLEDLAQKNSKFDGIIDIK
jgi:hypothetical protein